MYTDSDFILKINAAYNIFSFVIDYFLFEYLRNYDNICIIYYYGKKLRIGQLFIKKLSILFNSTSFYMRLIENKKRRKVILLAIILPVT